MVEIICRKLEVHYDVGRNVFARRRKQPPEPAPDSPEALSRAGGITSNHGVSALRGVDLHIEDGWRVGLVGENGAGKTTLLKVLSGIFKPKRGMIHVDGTVTSLISTRGGFDPSATGRSNIYIRARLQGMSKRRIDEVVDDIIAFADIGEFIDLPLATYSNGMASRLAFATATAFKSDIIIVDEGVMAGDEGFQMKAKQRLDDFYESSGILIIAAHSISLLSNLCTHALWLHQGLVHEFGDKDTVLHHYRKHLEARAPA